MNKFFKICFIIVIIGTTISCSQLANQKPVEQISIPVVDLMPNQPRPYFMRDWKKVTLDYDDFVFDFNKKGQYLPLIWIDTTRSKNTYDEFGFPAYVECQGKRNEAINIMAELISASLVGIDKSNFKGRNYVEMCQKYYDDKVSGLYLNTPEWHTGRTFWYESYISILFAQLIKLYPGTGNMEKHMIRSADRMIDAIAALKDSAGIPDFNYLGFDYSTMKPTTGNRAEPEAAAAYAWFEYMAYIKTNDSRYLDAASQCVRFLETTSTNPFYEVTFPYGAYLAVRMNAEAATSFNAEKLVNWCFGPTEKIRPGWGITSGKWGDFDVYGLCGSAPAPGRGYAFAMNTFAMAGALAPVPRYDQRYARAIGKLLLNCANASRLFYPEFLPDSLQSDKEWSLKYDSTCCIAYEGLRSDALFCQGPVRDFKTSTGKISKGDYRACQKLRDNNFEVLTEQVIGQTAQLDHIWEIILPDVALKPGWLKMECNYRGIKRDSMAYSVLYSILPGGPYKPGKLFDYNDRNKEIAFELAGEKGKRFYIKFTGKNKITRASEKADLVVDAIYIKYETDKRPYGLGDRKTTNPFDCGTDLGLYGSSHVGYLGGTIQKTNLEQILQIDLLKTDWYHKNAYPSFLFYNPFNTEAKVSLDAGKGPVDLYNTVEHRFIAKNISGETYISLNPDNAVVIVLTPSNGHIKKTDGKMWVNDVIVDYRFGQ